MKQQFTSFSRRAVVASRGLPSREIDRRLEDSRSRPSVWNPRCWSLDHERHGQQITLVSITSYRHTILTTDGSGMRGGAVLDQEQCPGNSFGRILCNASPSQIPVWPKIHPCHWSSGFSIRVQSKQMRGQIYGYRDSETESCFHGVHPCICYAKRLQKSTSFGGIHDSLQWNIAITLHRPDSWRGTACVRSQIVTTLWCYRPSKRDGNGRWSGNTPSWPKIGEKFTMQPEGVLW